MRYLVKFKELFGCELLGQVDRAVWREQFCRVQSAVLLRSSSTWNPDNPIIFGRWVFYGFLRAFRGNYGRLGNLWAFCFWLLKLRIIMGV